jgi:hypothetical protein
VTTPESVVKTKIKTLLQKYNVYYFMPVQTGYGPSGVDFHCVVRWKDIPVAFFIEAKAQGKETTKRQDEFIMMRFKQLNATTFVISGETGLRKLEQWLLSLQDQKTLLNPQTFLVTTVSQ